METDLPTLVPPHLWVKRGSGWGAASTGVCVPVTAQGRLLWVYLTLAVAVPACVTVWGWGSWIVWGQVCPSAVLVHD